MTKDGKIEQLRSRLATLEAAKEHHVANLAKKLRWTERYVKELEGLVRDMSPFHCDEWLAHCSDEADKEVRDDEH